MHVQWAITEKGKQDYRISLVLSAILVAAYWLREIIAGVDMEGEALVVYTVLPVVGWLVGALCFFLPIRGIHVLIDLLMRSARADRASS